MKRLSVILFCVLISLFSAEVLSQESLKEPKQTALTPVINNLSELSEAIDKIRIRTDTPGIGVGLIQPDQPDWQYYSGLSDIETRTSLSEDSQFRFASISKMLVSLSLLTLVEEGKLSLQDKLSEIAPELAFSNQWEASHPIRVIHLLNYSAGWDSPHFTEQRSLSTTPVPIIEALEAHPHSRISRWQPGSSVAYNNTSFLAAAYVIEKLTSQSFEAYVEDVFFTPLNMHSTGYYFSDTYRKSAVSLYQNKRALPYRHLNNRASGGLNSTIPDMVKLLTLLAKQQPKDVVSLDLLNTFQSPAGTKAADEGLRFSWGLGNQLFHSNGVLLFGHEGSLRGTNSILIYNPEHAFGYTIVSNKNSPAVEQIHRLLSNYLTKGLDSPKVIAERELNETDIQLSGWYQNAAPISGKFSLFSTIIPWKFSVNGNSASIKPLLGSPPRKLVPNDGNAYKQDTTGRVVLVPSRDESLGQVLYYGPQTLVKKNMTLALLPLIIAAFWVLMAVSGIIFMFIWLPRRLFKKSIPTESISFRSWPIYSLGIAILTLVCIRIITNSPSVYELSGTITLLSSLVFVGTLTFFLCALWSVWVLFENRNLAINRFTKLHTAFFTLAHFMVAILLLTHGLIGLRLWV